MESGSPWVGYSEPLSPTFFMKTPFKVSHSLTNFNIMIDCEIINSPTFKTTTENQFIWQQGDFYFLQ